jgi:uncharacterized membrane protein
MKTQSAAIAFAAATLFLSGGGPANAADPEMEVAKIKCEGVNQCKSHSACKTRLNECAGKNSCKGKGFLMLTPEECEAAKARMKEAETEALS